jgi:hypothetical protein
VENKSSNEEDGKEALEINADAVALSKLTR